MKIIFKLFFVVLVFTNSSLAKGFKGFGSYEFKSGKKKLTVWYNIPETLSTNTNIVFVMHGVKRSGEDYCKAWEKYSKSKNFILLVPEFSNKDFPGSRQYNLANIAESSGKINSKENWHFHIIEDVFNDVKTKLKLQTKDYYLYGHSAGSQFVHRFVLFYPEASLKQAISANAGWYTFPDSSIPFPYGIKGIGLNETSLKKSFSKKLVVLLGDKDTDPNHKYLRKAPEAMAQGKHRFERGKTFYSNARKGTSAIKAQFNWIIESVPGVAHSNSGMAKKAVDFIK